MPTTVITPNPATVATIHRGILPLSDTAFSSFTKINDLITKHKEQKTIRKFYSQTSYLVEEVTRE